MADLFDDPLHEMLAQVPLGAMAHGGAAWGEILAVRDAVTSGDDDSWYAAWRAMADAVHADAEAAERAGRRLDARLAYQRAATYLGAAYHPLYGAPVDARLADAFQQQSAALERAVALLDRPGEALAIPFDGTTLPGYLLTASDATGPLLVATNGYDAALADLFVYHALPALERGYHCVIFDGPGQGAPLIQQGMPMRSDWDTVVRAVLDHVIDRPEVDADRIALTGWSLGGHLALRAASGEHRLAACIADPGLYSIPDGMLGRLRALGVDEQILAGYPHLPDDVLDAMQQFIDANRVQHWTMRQRGFWVHGVDSLQGYLEATADFTLAGRLADVRCPALVASAEADVLSSSAPQVVAELGDRATALPFTSAEGAGTHCETGNRPLYDRRVFAWLADVLG